MVSYPRCPHDYLSMGNRYLLIVSLLQMLNTILSLLLQKANNMASVDGSKSWLGASDEIYDMVCGPCKTENLNKEAKHYCEQCQEHLCDACQGAHRKLKATKNHSILSGRHMPKASGVTPRPACSVYCSCNQNREVVVYCEDHDDVFAIRARLSNTGDVKLSPFKIKAVAMQRRNSIQL